MALQLLNKTLCALQLKNPFLLGKYMNEAYRNYHGILLAYDDGLARGDAVLAAALYRYVEL
jgi:hypothetical protein